MTQRNFNGEDGALARCGTRNNLMAQYISQSLHDGETQPETSQLSVLRGLKMFFENARHLCTHNPDTAVPDLDADFVTGTTAAQQNATAIGVADRIRNQIADHFRDHALVGMDGDPGANQSPSQALF